MVALDAEVAYSDGNFVIIVASMNYNGKKNFFDTYVVEVVIKLGGQYNPDTMLVIKSTISVGFTAFAHEKYHCDNIIFSPNSCMSLRYCMTMSIPNFSCLEMGDDDRKIQHYKAKLRLKSRFWIDNGRE